MAANQKKPAMFTPVTSGGAPSTRRSSGRSTRPPAVSCHPVKATRPTGRPHFLVSTTPAAIERVPATAAATPIRSSAASGPNTSIATPRTPARPANPTRRVNASPNSTAPSAAATRGWSAPAVAATPPGSRNAATKRSAKKAPMFNVPSTNVLHHHAPVGRVRVQSRKTIPTGRALAVAASSGRSGGSNSVVTR